MAYGNLRGCIPGLLAAGDLSAHQFKFVKLTATGVALAGLGEEIVGILQNKPDAVGEPAMVAPLGSVSKLVSSAALAVGDNVTSNASGLGVAPLINNYIHGFVTEASGAANELCSVFLTSHGRSA